MNRVLAPSLSVLCLLISAPAFATIWPTESEWSPIVGPHGVFEDNVNDTLIPSADIVGNDTHPAGFWFTRSGELFLRLRVNALPSDMDSVCPLWAVYIDHDLDGEADQALLVERPRFGSYSCSSRTPAADSSPTGSRIDDSTCTARVAAAERHFGSDIDALIEISLIEPEPTELSYDRFAPMRVFLSTWEQSDGEHTDILDINDQYGPRCDTLPPDETWSTPIAIDEDLDGLDYFEELALGTDPALLDTDSDALSDLEESILGTDPLLADTDGDSLTDGVEVLESLSDPFNPDSDSDGLNDGQEWMATNTDPNNPDSDSDGIGDAEEVACGGPPGDRDNDGIEDAAESTDDCDGDGTPSWCDSDSDNDTIPDSIETMIDTDHDSIPDLCDLDSDCDGRLDSAEGQSDNDCDGIPNRTDPNDIDSTCEDPEPDPEGNTENESKESNLSGQPAGGACDSTASPHARLLPFFLLFSFLFGLPRLRRN